MLEVLDRYYTFEPVCQLENDVLQIHHIDDRSKLVRVWIEGGSGEVFEKDFIINGEFSKAFSLDFLSEGNYTLNLITEREEHSYDFEVSR